MAPENTNGDEEGTFVEELKVSTNAPVLGAYGDEDPLLHPRLWHDQSSSKQELSQCMKLASFQDLFKGLNFSSPFAIFPRTVARREEVSLSVPSPVGVRRRFDVRFFGSISWPSLFTVCKTWLKHPMNIALLIWLTCVAVSATMLGLLLLGALDRAFPTKALRNHWIEINNQVLNALFTLMSLYQHPALFYHFVMLCRWRSEDIIELRKVYCKDKGYRPNEWAHMLVLVVLLHITCFSQYVLCGLYWGYPRRRRPELLENLFFALGIASPVLAALYAVYSPLGRDHISGSDEESQGKLPDDDTKGSRHALKLYDRRRDVVSKPEWVGGLFDCGDDMTICYLSSFCTFCLFGWNMERLGFGNMYVHVVTFLLLCVAPFWIFSVSALNINNAVIRDVVGIAGIVLCAFGLLYGGFWRIQMRKRFKLPRNAFCCGSAALTDYGQWMFCWPCSLAQEVRTGNFYDVQDDRFIKKLAQEEELIVPQNETNPAAVTSDEVLITIEEVGGDGSLKPREDATTTAPVQPLMQSEDRPSSSASLQQSSELNKPSAQFSEIMPSIAVTVYEKPTAAKLVKMEACDRSLRVREEAQTDAATQLAQPLIQSEDGGRDRDSSLALRDRKVQIGMILSAFATCIYIVCLYTFTRV